MITFTHVKNTELLPWLVWLSGLIRWPANQRVAGSIPSQGTGLGCGPGPQQGERERQSQIGVSLPLFLPPFPSLKNKIFTKQNTELQYKWKLFMSFRGQDVDVKSREHINGVMASFADADAVEFCVFLKENVMEVNEFQELVKRYLRGLKCGRVLL